MLWQWCDNFTIYFCPLLFYRMVLQLALWVQLSAGRIDVAERLGSNLSGLSQLHQDAKDLSRQRRNRHSSRGRKWTTQTLKTKIVFPWNFFPQQNKRHFEREKQGKRHAGKPLLKTWQVLETLEEQLCNKTIL